MTDAAGTPGSTPGGGWIPAQDPSKLTTDAVDKATGQYRRELTQLRELIEVRLNAMDRAVTEHASVAGQVRSEINEKITHLKDLHQEKFDGIDRRFEDRDARARNSAEAIEKALAAALDSAQKMTDMQNRANKELATQQDKANQDAIAKAQGATNEKINALEQVGNTSRQALADKIDDARTRLTAMESLTRGIKEAGGEQREVRGEQRLNTSQIIAAIATLAAVISLVLYIAKR